MWLHYVWYGISYHRATMWSEKWCWTLSRIQWPWPWCSSRRLHYIVGHFLIYGVYANMRIYHGDIIWDWSYRWRWENSLLPSHRIYPFGKCLFRMRIRVGHTISHNWCFNLNKFQSNRKIRGKTRLKTIESEQKQVRKREREKAGMKIECNGRERKREQKWCKTSVLCSSYVHSINKQTLQRRQNSKLIWSKFKTLEGRMFQCSVLTAHTITLLLWWLTTVLAQTDRNALIACSPSYVDTPQMVCSHYICKWWWDLFAYLREHVAVFISWFLFNFQLLHNNNN